MATGYSRLGCAAIVFGISALIHAMKFMSERDGEYGNTRLRGIAVSSAFIFHPLISPLVARRDYSHSMFLFVLDESRISPSLVHFSQHVKCVMSDETFPRDSAIY
jgi:hypothetical protein